MKRIFTIGNIAATLAVTAVANSYIFAWGNELYMLIFGALLLSVLLFVGVFSAGARDFKTRICAHGVHLLYVFSVSTVLSVLVHSVLAFIMLPENYKEFLFSMLYGAAVLAAVFWAGIITVYLLSSEMGVKLRLAGALSGFVPVLNIIMLIKIMKAVTSEINYEIDKERLDRERASMELCKTKYPLLLVHGFFFRDFKHFNYWGRIPKTLKRNGAEIYYGNHSSALAVSKSAEELAKRIEAIVKETGCEKLNVIAHSKGGLDTRYAIAKLGMDKYIASLTTVNTPHRGVPYADALLDVIPDGYQKKIASVYNKAYKKLGDENPDFLAAVADLTEGACEKFNAENPNFPKEIYVRSIGSVMNTAEEGPFPLNFTYAFAEKYGGKNDGLVAESSFKFGEGYTLLTAEGERGISHADVIDLTRANVKGFDVREFYVGLVCELKSKGL